MDWPFACLACAGNGTEDFTEVVLVVRFMLIAARVPSPKLAQQILATEWPNVYSSDGQK